MSLENACVLIFRNNLQGDRSTYTERPKEKLQDGGGERKVGLVSPQNRLGWSSSSAGVSFAGGQMAGVGKQDQTISSVWLFIEIARPHSHVPFSSRGEERDELSCAAEKVEVG